MAACKEHSTHTSLPLAPALGVERARMRKCKYGSGLTGQSQVRKKGDTSVQSLSNEGSNRLSS